MLRKVCITALCFCTLWLTSCHPSETKKKDNPVNVKPLEVARTTSIAIAPSIQKIASAQLPVPEGMQKAAILQHTDQIGTVDKPTMDGGIINAADGIPVYHPDLKSTVAENSATKITTQNNLEAKTSLSDRWATSTKVKAILENAAQTGKLRFVLQESEQKNLPASVALLPIVESAYQDTAISPKGALGSWQLMPRTAEDNGISAKDRTDFIPATRAALNYLYQLHQQFGNWTLAFAAYNAGQGRVMKALQENPTATSIETLDLPQKTKDYVNTLVHINQSLLQINQNS